MSDQPRQNVPDTASTAEAREVMTENPLPSLAAAPEENMGTSRTVYKEQLFTPAESEKLGLIMDVSLLLAVELGRTQLTVREILDLHKGSVVELDRMAGEVVDVFVNGQMMAHGEVVVVGEKFGVRITEIVAPADKAGGSQ